MSAWGVDGIPILWQFGDGAMDSSSNDEGLRQSQKLKQQVEDLVPI